MTTYGEGLDYNSLLDFLEHSPSNVIEGTYDRPSQIIVDDLGHIVHIESAGFGSDYISGLGYSWLNADAITVLPGSAYIPAYNRIVDLLAPITVPIPGTINRLYYLYLQESSGAGSVFVSLTSPDAEYYGTARTFPGDTSSRYIGCVKNDTAGRVIQFETEEFGNRVLVIYGEAQDSQTLMGWDGITATTTLQERSIGGLAPTQPEKMVPSSARTVNVALEKGGTAEVRVGWPLDQSFGIAPVLIPSGTSVLRPGILRLSPTQSLYYKTTSGTATLYLMVLSYYERR